MNNKKTSITINALSIILYEYSSKFIVDDNLKKIATKLNFNIENDEELLKLHEEMLILETWLITITCSRFFQNKKEQYEILDSFHDLIQEQENKSQKWIKALNQKYQTYTEALFLANDQPNIWWGIAKIFNKNLFGYIKEDFYFQATICEFCTVFSDSLAEILSEYKIENS